MDIAGRKQVVWIVDASAVDAQAAHDALIGDFAVEVLGSATAVLDRLAAGSAPSVLVIDGGGSPPAGSAAGWRRGVVDGELPDLPGVELCRVIRSTRSEVALPIVLVTARRDDDAMDNAMIDGLAAGANDLVIRPYPPAVLRARVKSLARIRKLNHRAVEVEAQLATTLRSIGDGVISTDLAGRVQFLNAVAVELTGWSPAEAVGRSVVEVFHILQETTRAVVESPVDKVLRDGKVAGLANHTLLRRRDGSEIPIDDSAAPIRDEAGAMTGVVLVFRDISDKKRAEAERESLLGALAAQPMLLVCVLMGPQLIYQMANAAYLDQMGGRDILGKPLLEALPELRGQLQASRMHQAMSTGIPYVNTEGESVLDRGDGQLVTKRFSVVYQPIRGKGAGFDGVLIIAQDVTDVVRARRALEAAKTQLQDIFELAPAVVGLIEGPEHRFALANPYFRALVNGRALVGRTVVDALPELVDQGVVAVLDKVWRSGQPQVSTETWIRLHGADGAPDDRCINFAYQPVRAADGNVESIFVHAVDVTELVRARQVAQRLEAEARSRAEFERQLIGIVSHDLRNPLSTILLGTQLLLSGDQVADKPRNIVARIESAAQRGSRMVSDLLDFTQARVGGGIPIALVEGNLHTLVRQVVDDVELTQPARQIAVTTSGDGQGLWDLDRMSQVILNLVTNALKYSPATSVVELDSAADADGVRLTIHNAGEAIPHAALDRIFHPMQRATSQLDNRGRSVGLGLFIVKHLVEAHGGRIAVSSTAAAGTTFVLWVPRRPIHQPG